MAATLPDTGGESTLLIGATGPSQWRLILRDWAMEKLVLADYDDGPSTQATQTDATEIDCGPIGRLESWTQLKTFELKPDNAMHTHLYSGKVEHVKCPRDHLSAFKWRTEPVTSCSLNGVAGDCSALLTGDRMVDLPIAGPTFGRTSDISPQDLKAEIWKGLELSTFTTEILMQTVGALAFGLQPPPHREIAGDALPRHGLIRPVMLEIGLSGRTRYVLEA